MSSIFCWHVILSGAIFFPSANVVPDAKVAREARGDVTLKRSTATRPCPRSIARDTYETGHSPAMRTWAKPSTTSLVADHRPDHCKNIDQDHTNAEERSKTRNLGNRRVADIIVPPQIVQMGFSACHGATAIHYRRTKNWAAYVNVKSK